MKFIFVLFLLFVVTPARADALEDAVAKDYPNWEIYQQVSGDLDGDGKADAAAIVWKQPKDDDYGSVVLAVYLAQGGKLKIQAAANNALCIGCGGPKGAFDQPLGTLTITPKGVLEVGYFSGARTSYDLTMKWRYDKPSGTFLLIGETRTVSDTMLEDPEEVIDINYLSMKMDKRVGKKKNTCAVPPQYKEQCLTEFEYDGEEDGRNAFLDRLAAQCKD